MSICSGGSVKCHLNISSNTKVQIIDWILLNSFSSCDPRGRRTSESVLGVWVPDTRTLPIIVLTRRARHSLGRLSTPLKQSFCRRRQRQRHVRAPPLHVSHFYEENPVFRKVWSYSARPNVLSLHFHLFIAFGKMSWWRSKWDNHVKRNNLYRVQTLTRVYLHQ